MNWEDRKMPEKFDFAEGVVLVGVLIDISARQLKDPRTGVLKRTNQYTVKEQDGDTVFFFGTYQIDAQMRPADIGHYVSIVCMGEDKNVERGGNAMKVFQIKVSKETAPGWAANGTPITDEDIPFI